MFTQETISLRQIHPEEFEQFFSLMETSFPADERRTYTEQKDVLNNPRYHIFVLPDTADNQIKGFITAWEFEGITYLEHFAVSPAYRNHGLGASIIQEILRMYSCRICLEVEFPETEFAKRRIGFYKRNGFYLNEYPYEQPAYSKEKNPVPLLIMTSGGEISEKEFEKIKKEIYKEVFSIEM